MMDTSSETLDWDRAEAYLKEMEAAYAEIGSPGFFALMFVIRPLRDRFIKGERTADLHGEIMDLK